MPSIVRSRLSLFAMMGIFLIPIGQANLSGLTHVLTCKQEIAQPFTVVIPPDGEPDLLSSVVISRDEPDSLLCGGLSAEPGVTTEGPGTITMISRISNKSPHLWRGTVTLRLGKTAIPVGIGQVPAGETRTERVPFHLGKGTFQLNGALSIGP